MHHSQVFGHRDRIPAPDMLLERRRWPVRIKLSGPSLSVRTCASRFSALVGSECRLERSCGTRGQESDVEQVLLAFDDAAGDDREIECEVAWHAPRAARTLPGSEATIQATCGLAHLHGLENGHPRPLGLEVASVTAGVLANQGLLANLIGGSNHTTPVSVIRTSVTHGALLAVSQYIARATSSDTWSEWLPVTAGEDPGPPFRSTDNRWFEIETLDPEAWTTFWGTLGVNASLFGRAWTLFRGRYSTATCTMPRGFHDATQERTLSDLTRLAESCGVSLSPVRNYREVLADTRLDNIWLPAITHTEAPFGATWAAPRLPGAASPPRSAETYAPLAGLRVVESTSRIQGPLAGQLLRMLGADVVRVEPPGGDPGRMMPPVVGDTGALFLCMNRGKQPIEIDLSCPAGRAELADLVRDADVFLHNWAPGKAALWRLDFDDLAPRNPGLVYCAASGWGESADKCPPIGMDFLVQAYAGVGNAIHPEGEPPLPTRLLVADFMGGMVATEGILAALYRRNCGAGASRVDTSLLAGAMSLHSHVLTAFAACDEHGRRAGRPIWTRWDAPFQTADGLIFVSVSDAAALKRLRAVLGIGDDDHSSAGDVAALASRHLADRPAREWQRVFLESGIPSGVVCTDLSELAANPLLEGCLEPVGDAWMPRKPWEFTTDAH